MDDRDFCASEGARLGLVHEPMPDGMEGDSTRIWCRGMVIRDRQWIAVWPLSALCLGRVGHGVKSGANRSNGPARRPSLVRRGLYCNRR